MSNFEDTFTKDGADKNLQYDDTAFYYFFSTIVLVIVVPVLISAYRQVFGGGPVINPKYPKGATTCNLRLADHIKERERYAGFNCWLFIKVIIILVLLGFWMQASSGASNSANLKSFDPYETLEIPRDANETIIKRAFRKMSVKYHPDKNPDDPQATAKFLLIKKAYDCLIDPDAKVNCEKFGNPDGAGSMSVAIALPSALLAKENKIKVLAVFFFILIVVIPGIVLYWYSENRRYDIDGVLIDNKRLFFQNLNENLIVKNVPRILASCFDFLPICAVRSDQANDFRKLNQEVSDVLGKPNLDIKFWKPHHLLCAYLSDIKLGPSLTDDLYFMLKRIPKLLEAMVEFSFALSMTPSQKVFGLRCCLALIDFSQYFYQGLWTTDSTLLQLSCLEKDTINRITKKARRFPTLSELIKSPQEDKQHTYNFIPEENRAAFEKEIKNFPNIRVEHSIGTFNEKEIVWGDGVTLQVKIIRENPDAVDQDAVYCYSHKFPIVKKEKWFIIVADEARNRVLMQKSTTSGKKIIEEKFEFPIQIFVPGEMPVQWKLYIKSDCYRELDQEIDIKFFVHHPQKIKREEIKLNSEDEKIFREPSFYAKMLNPNAGAEDSDEELEDEEKEKQKKAEKKVKKDEDEELEEEDEEEEEKSPKKETEISTKKK